jgi:AbiTii
MRIAGSKRLPDITSSKMRIAPAFFRRRRWPSRSWSSVETRAELGSKPLVWVLWESNGYPNDVELPSCRMLPMTLKGNFTGVAWKGEGIIIPIGVVPEKVRKDLKKYQLRQSIAVVQRGVRQARDTDRRSCLRDRRFEHRGSESGTTPRLLVKPSWRGRMGPQILAT